CCVQAAAEQLAVTNAVVGLIGNWPQLSPEAGALRVKVGQAPVLRTGGVAMTAPKSPTSERLKTLNM
ncbi:MAG TPA: hypothetical protein DCQ83_04180, partial [Fibrobacteres bacterium]|nr:hypothetical protein [Fibrobacterota bacterium]